MGIGFSWKWTITLSIIAFSGFYLFQLIIPLDTSELETKTFDEINSLRIENREPQLQWDKSLHQLAKNHSSEMAKDHALYHSNSGMDFYENIYSGSTFNSDIVSTWLESLEHGLTLIKSDAKVGAVGIERRGTKIYATFMAK